MAVAVDRGPAVQQLRDRPHVVHAGGSDQRAAQLGAMIGEEVDECFQVIDRRHRQDQALEERRMALRGHRGRQAGVRREESGQCREIAGGEGGLRRLKSRVHFAVLRFA